MPNKLELTFKLVTLYYTAVYNEYRISDTNYHVQWFTKHEGV